MGISLYKIKKWYRMLTGSSIMHVNQNLGQCFKPGELAGYFNNLTEKVLKDPATLEKKSLPTATDESGNPVVFPVTIFQYGLGAYDLFLQTEEEKYLSQFLNCAGWAFDNQLDLGAWSNFYFVYPNDPYGAMCQGEGASLLLRAWKVTGEEKYLQAAKRALDFMLKPVEEGGTARYDGEDLILLEYTHLPAVLNGWAFALAGLYDMVVSGQGEDYRPALEQTVDSLEKYLPAFDNGYWSLYDLDRKLTSPFYHDLHIAQMQAMKLMTGREVFGEYAVKWEKYAQNKWNSARAFIKKAWQKVTE